MTKPTAAQARAIKSVDPERGSINASPAVFRRVVEEGWVKVETRRNVGFVVVTDKGRAAVEEA
jgi:hypothetical protein